jgi:hypothetical protein
MPFGSAVSWALRMLKSVKLVRPVKAPLGSVYSGLSSRYKCVKLVSAVNDPVGSVVSRLLFRRISVKLARPANAPAGIDVSPRLAQLSADGPEQVHAGSKDGTVQAPCRRRWVEPLVPSEEEATDFHSRELGAHGQGPPWPRSPAPPTAHSARAKSAITSDLRMLVDISESAGVPPTRESCRQTNRANVT